MRMYMFFGVPISSMVPLGQNNRRGRASRVLLSPGATVHVAQLASSGQREYDGVIRAAAQVQIPVPLNLRLCRLASQRRIWSLENSMRADELAALMLHPRRTREAESELRCSQSPLLECRAATPHCKHHVSIVQLGPVV
jgi:hypothetical protein